MNKEQIQEQIAQCRKYADSQTMCGFDAGRSSSCYADWFWDEVADTLQSLLDRIEVLERVREAAKVYSDSVDQGFASKIRPDIARARLNRYLKAAESPDGS